MGTRRGVSRARRRAGIVTLLLGTLLILTACAAGPNGAAGGTDPAGWRPTAFFGAAASGVTETVGARR